MTAPKDPSDMEEGQRPNRCASLNVYWSNVGCSKVPLRERERVVSMIAYVTSLLVAARRPRLVANTLTRFSLNGSFERTVFPGGVDPIVKLRYE